MKKFNPQAEVLKDKGNAFMQKGNPDKAIAAYREAIRTDPKYTPAYANLGMALAMTGNIEEAENVYLEALKIDPNDYRQLLNLGVLYIRTDQYAKAMNTFSRLVDHVPDVEKPHTGAMAYLYMAIGNVKQQNYIKAYQTLITALELNPEVEPNALELLQDAVQEELEIKKKEPVLLSIAGVVDLINDDIDQAIKTFKKAIAVDSNSAEAYYGLGLALSSSHEDDAPFDNKTSARLNKAVEAFSKTTELKPTWAEAYYQLGTVSLQLVDFESPHRAYNSLQQVVELAKKQKLNNDFVEKAKQLLQTNEVLKEVGRRTL